MLQLQVVASKYSGGLFSWGPQLEAVTLCSSDTAFTRRIKPAFYGACFGAVSAPILSARVPLRASAAFEKERFHYEHSSCFHGRRLPR